MATDASGVSLLGSFGTGSLSTTPTSQTVSNVAPYAQGYVTNLLGNTQALTNAPMPTYTGALTPGSSNLQNQAWSGLSGLTLPSDLSGAGTALGNTASEAANVAAGYNPTDFTNTYQAPTAYQGLNAQSQYQTPSNLTTNVNYTNQFAAPQAYNPNTVNNTYASTSPYAGINATNQYQGTSPYQGIQATSANFNDINPQTGKSYAEEYMNPYLAQSLDPQLQLLQQQLGTQNAQTNAQLAQAGAYGGGRQAVADAQNTLNSNLAANALISQGYNTAYNTAQQAFTADQARNLQAQQANIGQQEFGATQAQTNAQQAANYSQQAQAANIQQAQYAASQGMTDAQMTAQYGMTAEQANQAAAQFAASQGMTAAQYAAQYGQSAQTAQGQQAQFNAQQGMTNATNAANYGQQAQAANIQQGQFSATQNQTVAQQQAAALQAQQNAQQAATQYGSSLGLQGLQAAASAQQAQGNIGAQEASYGLQNLQALGTAGNTQQTQNQAALTAQYNQYLAQLQYPQTMLTLQKNVLSGMPISGVTTYNAAPSMLASLMGTSAGIATLAQTLTGMSQTQINDYLKGLFTTDPNSTVGSGGNAVSSDGTGGIQSGSDKTGSSTFGQGSQVGTDENGYPVYVVQGTETSNPVYTDQNGNVVAGDTINFGGVSQG